MITNFTPIKNKILIDIIAKGRLSYRETRIASYIIRNSWRYSFNGSRQQWTKQLSVTKIAKDIGLSRCKCSMVINRMIKEKKLLKKRNQYQFNERYEEWVLQKGNSVQLQKMLPKCNNVTKLKHPEVFPNCNGTVTKTERKCYQKVTAVLPFGNTQPLTNTDEKRAGSYPKDTLKENIKENILSKDRELIQDNPNLKILKDFPFKEISLTEDKENPLLKAKNK